MQRLHRIKTRGQVREALPGVIPPIDQLGVKLRRGQVSLLASDPNHGKSMLALVWAIQLAQQHGKRVLYFSADTDESDTLRRAAAHLTGKPQDYVEQAIRSGGEEVETALAALQGRLSFCFETDPSYQDLKEELIAHWELWGCYPDLVVVDNLMDVDGESEDEYGSMRNTTKAVKRYARQTDSHFMVTHHTNEARRDNPPALHELTGKVGKKPELVMTIQFVDATGEFRVAVVKGRSSKKDRTGADFISMRMDGVHAQFYDDNYQKIGA